MTGCESNTPSRSVPPYLAIVTKVDALPGVDIGRIYAYRVREASGTLHVDTLVEVSPRDTVILSVRPATYLVSVESIPSQCAVRGDTAQGIVVAPKTNTSLIRYAVSCRPSITLETASDGFQVDSEIVYELSRPGVQRLGLLGANDTVRLSDVAAGDYTLSLHFLAEHCLVINGAGVPRSITVDPSGGAVVDLRIRCSDEAQRPRFLSLRSSYHDGVNAFIARVADPTRDIERYAWDLTDCRGNSVLPRGGQVRRGLSGGRTALLDTVTVVAAFEVGIPDAAMAGRCTSLRIEDEVGNTTPMVEDTLVARPGMPPEATQFNAHLVFTQSLKVDLKAADPDGDFVGTFVGARLRDGSLGPPDGADDLGIYNTAGYLGDTLPDVVFTPDRRPAWDDFYAVVVYLIDAQGHFTRIEDTDVFH